MADGVANTGATTPVAIVGMAAVFPGARDLETFWANIEQGVDAVTDVPPDRVDPVFFEDSGESPDRFYCRRGGFIDSATSFDPTQFGIMPVAAAEAEPDQLLALATAQRALEDAGYGEGVPAPDRAAVILGRGGYMTPGVARLDQRVRVAQQLVESVRDLVPDIDDERLHEIKRRFQEALGPSDPDASIGLVPNLVASRVANRLDLHGPAYSVDAACASSLIALSHAMTELDSGRCDLVLAGGVHHCHDVTLWSVFCQLRALSPSEQIRPFDRRADGIVIGEGTGVLVLKRLADAERDGDRIYAVVRGVGVASDGRAATLMSPAVEGQVRAVERAWSQAGLDPATVGLIEAHGTATPAGDAAELATIRRVFGDEVFGDEVFGAGAPGGGAAGERHAVGLGSVKSMIGHAMPASGAAGLIKAALSAYHGVKPPTLHCDEPHPDLDGSRFEIVREAQEWSQNGVSRRVGVNAFGFGGINAHVVIEAHHDAAAAWTPARSVPAEPSADASEPTVLFVAAGESVAEVLEQLGDDQRVFAGTDLGSCQVDGPVRLVIADPTERRLETARKVVDRGSAWRGRNDIWFSPSGLLTAGGGLAYTFPGVEPTVTPDISDVVEHFGIAVPDPVFGSELGNQGADIIRLARVGQRALSLLGIEPDLVAGHSLGEWSAMIVAEAVPAADVDAFIAGLVGGELIFPDLVYLALGCGADQAHEAIMGLEEISVSHDNCTHQAIICGREDSVRIAQERLKAQRVLGQELPFRTGFHTPMFRDYMGPFEAVIDSLPVQEARIPLWSATTAAPFPADEETIRDLAARLYVEPVRFRELVDELYADGVRVFVQPGVGSVTGFIEDTLKDREHMTIAAAVAKRTGMAQMKRVAAALFVEGADVRWAALAPGGGTAVGQRITQESMPLRLGAGLVRGALEPLDRPGRVRPAASEPALGIAGRYQATLSDIDDAADAVFTALEDRVRAETDVEPPPPEVSTSPASTESADTDSFSERRPLSVALVPELIDHTFYRQPAGGVTLSDRYPVVPMTMMLSMFVEAAERLAPGRVAIGLQNVRALRWLAVEPPVEAHIEARMDGPDRVRVSIEGYSRAVVTLADGYGEPPAPDSAPLRDESPALHTADEFYRDRWMFHGPAYQAVTALHTMGSDGFRGSLRALPAPGALLDAAGQLFGYWIMVNTTVDRVALPMRIDRIDLYGPHPEPDTALECTVRVTDLTDTDARGDLELVQDGRVWARVGQFTDRRFESTDELFEIMRFPETNIIAERVGGGWHVREHWRSTATRELVMRRYLNQSERDHYEGLTPKDQRNWLLGRIAVKDAVRDWLWARGAGEIFPIEIAVADGPDGQPVVDCAYATNLAVSLELGDLFASITVEETHHA